MVTWFTFSLSLSFLSLSLVFSLLFFLHTLRFLPFALAHIYIYASAFISHIDSHTCCIYIFISFFFFFFVCTYNFNLLSTSYNLSTYASRYHFFPIRYTYQLTHLTCSLYTCLSLYENIRPYYLCSLAFAFLISRVFDDRARVFERKKKMSYES